MPAEEAREGPGGQFPPYKTWFDFYTFLFLFWNQLTFFSFLFRNFCRILPLFWWWMFTNTSGSHEYSHENCITVKQARRWQYITGLTSIEDLPNTLYNAFMSDPASRGIFPSIPLIAGYLCPKHFLCLVYWTLTWKRSIYTITKKKHCHPLKRQKT